MLARDFDSRIDQAAQLLESGFTKEAFFKLAVLGLLIAFHTYQRWIQTLADA